MTTAIGPYPAYYETDMVMRDGRMLRLRPARPEDAPLIRDLFNRLSPTTVFLRFHHVLNHLSDADLRLLAEVDYHTRFSLLGVVGVPGREQVVALGQFVRPDERPVADIAFLVADAYQGQGIGTVLLENLARIARDHGVTRFLADVLEQNVQMMEVFRDSGFHLAATLEDGVYQIELDLLELREVERLSAERDHLARVASIRYILAPRSVAVIGASRQRDTIAGAVFERLLGSQFQGPVYPVNKHATHVQSVRAYGSVTDVPDAVDLAVVVVPADQVLDVADGCIEQGVRGLAVISAGFRETGEEGVRREQALRTKVRAHGIRLLGPNCLGVLNTSPHVRLNATFAPALPPSGSVAVASQSGALGLAILDYARDMDVGLSHFVSMGNRADISSNDLLEYWEDDPETQVILLYLESFGNPGKFARIARRVARNKPIIAVKGGRSSAGSRAATSHTGALASANVAVDALFEQAGVIRVETIEELFGAAAVLSNQPRPRGRRLGIVTNAGGPGILASDAAEAHGMQVSALPSATQADLRTFLPLEAAVANPVDMIASASASQYGQAVRRLLEEDEMDAILAIYIPPLVTQPEDVAVAVRDAVAEGGGEKPVIASFMSSAGAPLALRGRDSGHGPAVPSFQFPENAIRALARAMDYTEWRERPRGHVPDLPDVRHDEAERVMMTALREQAGDRVWLYPEQALDLLSAYGFRVPRTRAALSMDEAVAAAEHIGYPVALKLRSSTVLHKTDIGGVALGLRGADEVRQSFERVRARLVDIGRGEEMEGVLVQEMAAVARGVEMAAGVTRDDAFGPLVMVGLGGVFVELLKDVSFRLQPVTDVDAERMLTSLRGYPLLTGYRGAPKTDVDALKDVILRLSAFVEDFPQIAQADLNPVLVGPEGHGCLTLDTRLQVTRDAPRTPGAWPRGRR